MKVLYYVFFGAAMAVAPMSIHAETTQTWALGSSMCSPGQAVNCWGVPATDGTQHGTVWIDLTPYQDPYASRWFDTGIDGLGIAAINYDKTYFVQTTTAHYTTADGREWSGTMPQSISFTYSGTTSSGQPYLGTGTVVLGHYYYVDVCGGRGCGGSMGWHYSVVGGSITVQIK